MGASVSFDVGGAPIEDVINFRPSGSLPRLKFRSNLKAWRFYMSSKPLEVRAEALAAATFGGFDDADSYILLHIYHRSDDAVSHPAGMRKPATASLPAATASAGGGSMSVLASNVGDLLSPRGLAAPFSGYDDCGPYPFERNSSSDEVPLAHDIYIWNGKKANALTKAVALTKCFELERALINDEVGAIHYLHRGMGRELQPASFDADYVHAKNGSDSNHLLATLAENASSDAIHCSSLLACMMPGMSNLATSSFPELQKALYSHLTPEALHERDLGGATPRQAPPASPSASSTSASPGGHPSPPLAARHQFASAMPPPAAAPPAAAPAPPASRPASARPQSAGGNGFKLAGLSSLPREPEPAITATARPAAGGGGLPPLGLGKLGGGSGAPALTAPKINLAGLTSSYDRENDDGRMSQAEKLRIFSKKCSQITEELYLGADEVARDLAVLRGNGITHVLNTAGVACANYHEGTSELQYRVVHLYDSPKQDISCVVYSCVEYIDAAIEGGGKVFVHCHQGVSRSTTMVVAYLMWKRGLNFNDAFAHVKALRAVANPNAGFLCKLLAYDKALRATSPPQPAKLYRMAPDVGGPVGRQIELSQNVAPTTADLDARSSWVVFGASGLCVWHGERSHADYQECARALCLQLGRFERAPPAVEMAQGSETAAFWSMVDDAGGIAARLPTYDDEYGVGKTPSLAVTEPVLSLPADRPLPGVHTTATEDARLPSARGGGLGLGGLGLSKLDAAPDRPPPTPCGPPDDGEPLPSPRGRPAQPLPYELLPTPRGRPAPDEGEEARLQKKARDEAEEQEAAEGAARRGEPLAELYSHPDWADLSMFDRDDLLDEGVFVLLVYADDRMSPERLIVWVGGESELSGERDADILELADEFTQAKELGQLPAAVVHQGEENDADGFWDYFVN